MIIRKIAVTLATIVVFICFCLDSIGQAYAQESDINPAADSVPAARAQRIIAARARQVILALKSRDMARLSKFVHPDKGVRFTPYNYVSLTSDMVFSRPQIRNLLSSKRMYVWGDYEGSGDPIRLTFARYYKRFVYDKDFANMPGVSYETFNTRGRADNPWEFYSGAIVVGYYYVGVEGPRGGGMVWKGLRLVFQQKRETWYLVGILHDEWLI